MLKLVSSILRRMVSRVMEQDEAAEDILLYLNKNIREDFIKKVKLSSILGSLGYGLKKEIPEADKSSLYNYLSDRFVQDAVAVRLKKRLMEDLMTEKGKKIKEGHDRVGEGLSELDARKVVSPLGAVSSRDDLKKIIFRVQDDFGKMIYSYIDRTMGFFVKDYIREQKKKKEREEELGREDQEVLPEHEQEQKTKEEESWEKGLLPELKSYIDSVAGSNAKLYKEILQRRFIDKGLNKTEEDVSKNQADIAKDFSISQPTVFRAEKDLLALAKAFIRKNPDLMRKFPKFKHDEQVMEQVVKEEEGDVGEKKVPVEDKKKVPNYQEYMKAHSEDQKDLFEWVMARFKKGRRPSEQVINGLELLSKGKSFKEVGDEIGRSDKSVQINIYLDYFKKAYEEWYKAQTEEDTRKAFYMIMSSFSEENVMDYDLIGVVNSSTSSDVVDYDHIVEGADVERRTPAEAEKIKKERERVRNIELNRDKLLEKGVKPSEKPRIEPEPVDKKEEPSDKKAPKGPKEPKEKKAPETGVPGKGVENLIERIKKNKDVLVNITFRADFDATGKDMEEGKDPKFEWVGYEAIIDEVSGRQSVEYRYYKKLEGVDVLKVKNALHVAPYDEKLSLNGVHVGKDDQFFKDLHDWMMSDVLSEGIKPKGHVSVHYFNLTKDPNMTRPFSSTAKFMDHFRGIFVSDSAHNKWVTDREDFLRKKKLGPKRNLTDWTELTEAIKEYETMLETETDPENKKLLESEIKVWKEELEKKKEEQLTEEDKYMEMMQEHRKMRKPTEHVFDKKAGLVYAAVFPVPGPDDADFMAILNRLGLDHDPNPKMWMKERDFQILARSIRITVAKKIDWEISKLKKKDPAEIDSIRKDYEGDLKKAEELLPKFLENYIIRAEEFKKAHPTEFKAKPDAKWLEDEMAKAQPLGEVLKAMKTELISPIKPKEKPAPSMHGLERGRYNSLLGHLKESLAAFYGFGSAVERSDITPAGGVETREKVMKRREEMQEDLKALVTKMVEIRKNISEREDASLNEKERNFLKNYEDRLRNFQDQEAAVVKNLVKMMDSTKETPKFELEEDKKFIEEQIAHIKTFKEGLEGDVKKFADEEEKKSPKEIKDGLLNLIPDYCSQLADLGKGLNADVKEDFNKNLTEYKKDLLEVVNGLNPEKAEDGAAFYKKYDEIHTKYGRKFQELAGRIKSNDDHDKIQSMYAQFSSKMQRLVKFLMPPKQREDLKDWQKKWREERGPEFKPSLTTEEMTKGLDKALKTYEDKLKGIEKKLKPVTKEEEDKTRVDLDRSKNQIQKSYLLMGNIFKTIEEKKEGMTEEERKELRILDRDLKDMKADIAVIEADLQAKSAIPAVLAAKVLKSSAEYFSKLYTTLSGSMVFQEKYEDVGVVYSSEDDMLDYDSINKEVIVAADDEEEDVDLTTKALVMRKSLAKMAKHVSGLPIKAKDKIKGTFTKIKKDSAEYLGVLSSLASELNAKKAADDEKTYDEKFMQYRINEDLMHQAKSVIDKIKKNPKDKISARAGEAGEELKKITENIIKAYKEGFTNEKIKSLAEKKTKETGRHVSLGQAAVELNKHKDVLTKVLMNNFYEKWENINIQNPGVKERHLDEDTGLAKVLKHLLPKIWEQKIPEQDPKIPSEGVPTPTHIREDIEKIFTSEKEMTHEDLITEYKATLDEHSGGGGGGGGGGRSRPKAVRPNPPSYIGDIVKENAAKGLMGGANSGTHIIDKTMASFASGVMKQYDKLEDGQYMDPQMVLDRGKEALFDMYNSLLRLKVHPIKWSTPPKGVAPKLSGPPDIAFETHAEAEKILKNWIQCIEEINFLLGTKKYTVPKLKYIGPKGMSGQEKGYLPFGFVDGVNDLAGAPKMEREPHPKYKGDKWSPLDPPKGDKEKEYLDKFNDAYRREFGLTPVRETNKDRLEKFKEEYEKEHPFYRSVKDEAVFKEHYKRFDEAYKKEYDILPSEEKNERRLKRFENEYRTHWKLPANFNPAKREASLFEFPSQMSYNIAAKFAGMELSDDEFTAVLS